MVYLIIGPSCAGKTSYTVNTFIHGQKIREYRDLIPVSECDNCLLIGKYITSNRTKGTDRVSRKDIPKISEQVLRLVPQGRDIILEGDKICSQKIFDELKSKTDCKLIYVCCSLATTIERNMRNNSLCKESHLRTVATKAKNLFWKYESIFDGEIVETDSVKDFSKLHAGNCVNISYKSSTREWYRKLAEYAASEKGKIFSGISEYDTAFACLIKHPNAMRILIGKDVDVDVAADCFAPKILNERWRKGNA